MNRLLVLIVVLASIILVETTVIALPYLASVSYAAGPPQTYNFSYPVFDQPISNDSDVKLQPDYGSSWLVTIHSSLTTPSSSASSEAQIALAPNYKTENLSLPTMIVQERGDGLLRIEYYAQDWNNTFGLVLYNSTSPTWLQGENVTLRFIVFGPPSQINPQLAPRPNGNLTISIGGVVVLSNYPIPWARLSHIYMYGLHGSSFRSGAMTVTFNDLSRS